MSVPLMSPLEIIANEATRLEQRKASLLASIKAEESRLKDLRETAHIHQVECDQKIEQAKFGYEKEREKLTDTLHPLKSEISQLRSQIVAAKKEVELIRQGKDAILREKKAALDALDTKIARATKIHTSLGGAIDKLKVAIAGI